MTAAAQAAQAEAAAEADIDDSIKRKRFRVSLNNMCVRACLLCTAYSFMLLDSDALR